MIAHECLHSLNKKKGKRVAMLVKIDLEKAYDRIDWLFLQEVLQVIGVSDLLRKVIISCISSSRLAVIWNG